MHHKTAVGSTALLLLLVLTGCAGGGSGGGSGPYDDGAPSAKTTSSAAHTGDALATGDTSLGAIVVDGAGMTVYMFDSDTKGTTKSACTGTCLTNWPLVTTTSATPAVEGVTGTVGTISAPGGKRQVTLDGWPLYTFAGDHAPGDVAGQGVGGIWWALTPGGTPIGR
ncbi:COG4315 family predicted lipoprotein [Microbacterium elymi]|uniref:Lipoprotein with Yx(FWY)xxD motif n=1 Tax=Microbacterium elymi TaxID=2909587 RepID=A0ABY5NK86_9MICO|nr:hypothetical protein [Microbacterium elymi]UUT35567.1 hypothetical protein L2X98_19785 [Microbacterium elymi]